LSSTEHVTPCGPLQIEQRPHDRDTTARDLPHSGAERAERYVTAMPASTWRTPYQMTSCELANGSPEEPRAKGCPVV
jgi:hypothetical protein